VSRDADLVGPMLTETRAEVSIADHKASLVLAGLGVGFGAALGGLLAGDWSPDHLNGFARTVWWLAAAAAIASILCAAAAVWPRFKTSDVDDGILYWGHNATFESFDAWTARLDEQDHTPQDRDRRQLWELSRIVKPKYTLVRWALSLSGAAVGLFIISALAG
jgi:hypothetical protein